MIETISYRSIFIFPRTFIFLMILHRLIFVLLQDFFDCLSTSEDNLKCYHSKHSYLNLRDTEFSYLLCLSSSQLYRIRIPPQLAKLFLYIYIYIYISFVCGFLYQTCYNSTNKPNKCVPSNIWYGYCRLQLYICVSWQNMINL